MPITIVTHNGGFHADDVFGTALLLIKLTREGVLREDVQIIRTRDEGVIAQADYVLDVGGMYNPLERRFDHHQPGGAGVRANAIPYASFGLIWKEYGEELSGSQEVAQLFDSELVAPVDAGDNGCDISHPVYKGIEEFAIQDYITLHVPTWEEKGIVADERFMELLPFAVALIERQIVVARSRIKGNRRVREIYEGMEDKRLLILDEAVPWKLTAKLFPEILFVVIPEYEPANGWRVHTVRKHEVGFENKKDLPRAWAGLRDADLARVTGVKDARFCHNKLFTASTQTKEGALALARLALSNEE